MGESAHQIGIIEDGLRPESDELNGSTQSAYQLKISYGRACRLKYDHIMGFILKSVTPAP
jgi:hypothetical protein